MAILSISSQVARGYVGNTTALAALPLLAIEVWTIPTIILSNHKAHQYCNGTVTDPDGLREQFDALENNGWLGEIDAVLTGYLASPGQARVCAQIVARVKAANGAAFHWCDPVLGDDPGGLYVAEDIAKAVARYVVPCADILSPNAFELGWLAGVPVSDAKAARQAIAGLDCGSVMVTSVPGDKLDTISNLLVHDSAMWRIDHDKFPAVPHGTGDLFTALACGHYLANGGELTVDRAALVTALEEASSSLYSLAKVKAGCRGDNLSLSDIREATLAPNASFEAAMDKI